MGQPKRRGKRPKVKCGCGNIVGTPTYWEEKPVCGVCYEELWAVKMRKEENLAQ